MPEFKTLSNGYIAAHTLVKLNDQSYFKLDALPRSPIAAKNNTEALEFIKRDLTWRVVNRMQPWREIARRERAYHQVRFACLIYYRINADDTQAERSEAHIGGGEDPAGKGVHAHKRVGPSLITVYGLAEEFRRLCALTDDWCLRNVIGVGQGGAGMEETVQGE
ncbi:hypothetical protein FIBSPDRAFT_1038425 [Athelia psychrophila]|uniref:Uncharacterized protein n=1 Tax=Athelia psychrophila TaxID=1759441 RepID=A0A166T155_9AGAM|nr:hypothetical protein FIBSPDRAFT_1038425 [Fibularhizoctonia sp. CBS 109695]